MIAASIRPPIGSIPMFRWPDRLPTVILAYGLVFIGLPILCVLSYLWVKGAI